MVRVFGLIREQYIFRCVSGGRGLVDVYIDTSVRTVPSSIVSTLICLLP